MEDELKVTDKSTNLSYDRSCCDVEQHENNPPLQNNSSFDRQLNISNQKNQANNMSHMKSNSYYHSVDERYAIPNIAIPPNEIPSIPQYIENAYGVNLMIPSPDGQSIRFNNLPENYGQIECQVNPFPNNINYIDAQISPLVSYSGFFNAPYPEMPQPVSFSDPKLIGDRMAITNDPNSQVCVGPHDMGNLRSYNTYHYTQNSSVDSPDMGDSYMQGSLERKKSNGRKENHNMIERRYRSQISRCFTDLDSITFPSAANDSGARTKSQILRSATEKIKLLIADNQKLMEENVLLKDKVKKLCVSVDNEENMEMVATENENYDSETGYKHNHASYYGKNGNSSVNIIGIVLAVSILINNYTEKSLLHGTCQSLYINFGGFLIILVTAICWIYLSDARIKDIRCYQYFLSCISALYQRINTLTLTLAQLRHLQEGDNDRCVKKRALKYVSRRNKEIKYEDIRQVMSSSDKITIGSNCSYGYNVLY